MFSKTIVSTKPGRITLFRAYRQTNNLPYFRVLLALTLLLIAIPALASVVAVESRPAPASVTGAPDSQLNSAKAGYSFALPQTFREQLSAAAAGYTRYVKVTDDSEAMTMEVPAEWTDVDSGVWTYRGRDVGVFIAASSNLADFYATRSTPGVFIGVSRVLAQARDDQGVMTFEQLGFAQRCQRQGRYSYKDPFYGGQYDLYAQCVAGGRNRMVVVALPANREHLVLLRIKLASEADLQAVSKIFETFQVLGDPQVDPHHDH